MGFVQRKLVNLVIRVVSFPKLTLAICVGVLLASVTIAFLGLRLSTDEDQLLTPKLKFFREYKEFTREFPENDAFVVIIEPLSYLKPPPAQRWIDFSDRITAALITQEGVTRIDSRVPPNEMGVQGLAFDTWDNVRETAPHAGEMAQLARIVGDPESVESRFLGGGLSILTGQSNMTLRTLEAMRQGGAESSGPMTAEILRSLANAAKSQRPRADWTRGNELFRMWMSDPRAVADPRTNGYSMIPDETKRKDAKAYKTEQMLVIPVHTNRDFSSLSDVTEPLKRMREAVDKIAPDFPDFKRPVITGRAALEADQMETSDHDTRIAEIMGLSLVFIVLLVFLRNLWLVVAAELCLMTGIGWTFGWATLAVGRLNLLSLVFVIALIGIGMDYLIQILVRYRFEKKRYGRPQAIWARVFRFVSPPISTACCGAAGAFFASLFTNFRGASELGLIAGGGLLLCLIAGYTLLPALLTVFPAKVGRVDEARRYRHREGPPKAGGWRLLPAAIWVVVAGVGLLLAWPPRFDPNLLKLQDDSLPSVQAVRKIGTWSAVVTSTDLQKLRAARESLLSGDREKSTIDRTESLLDAYDKGEFLAKNADTIKVNWHEPEPPTAGQLREIADAAQKIASQWSAGGSADPLVKQVQGAAGDLAAALRSDAVPAAEKIARMAEWQKQFVKDVRDNTEQFAPPPPHLENLPPALREHLVSKGVPVFMGRGTDAKGVYAKIGYPDEPEKATIVHEGDVLVWGESVVKKIVSAGETAVVAGQTVADDAIVLTGVGHDKPGIVPLGRDLNGNIPAPLYALYIYPRGDLWESGELSKFVIEVESRVDAHKAATKSDVILTGIAMQLFHSTAEIHQAFLHSTGYALLLIVILVFLDLRKIGQTLMAVCVLALGLPMLQLMMYIWHNWWGDPFGIPGAWNFANFFALPILIGAGHEYGVFLVHRYRETLHDPRRVWRPWDVADRALLLCGIVTTASFGFLTMAHHHGLQSLGWVMAVGTACIYFAAIIVLRPILTWRLNRKAIYAPRVTAARKLIRQTNHQDTKAPRK